MFAGPNGSGKSTLIQEVKKSYPVGFFVNADEIESQIRQHKFLDTSYYSTKNVDQNEWMVFIGHLKKNDKRVDKKFPDVKFKDKFLVCKEEINSYQASIITEFFRFGLLKEEQTFSFETVMSHRSKVEFLKKAKEAGFITYLYFICTQDPKINLQRIKNRVEKGGHDVGEQTTIKRYFRSLDLLFEAFLLADRAYVIDSSNKNRDVILEKKKNNIHVHNQNIPEWVGHYLLDKIESHNRD